MHFVSHSQAHRYFGSGFTTNVSVTHAAKRNCWLWHSRPRLCAFSLSSLVCHPERIFCAKDPYYSARLLRESEFRQSALSSFIPLFPFFRGKPLLLSLAS